MSQQKLVNYPLLVSLSISLAAGSIVHKWRHARIPSCESSRSSRLKSST